MVARVSEPDRVTDVLFHHGHLVALCRAGRVIAACRVDLSGRASGRRTWNFADPPSWEDISVHVDDDAARVRSGGALYTLDLDSDPPGFARQVPLAPWADILDMRGERLLLREEDDLLLRDARTGAEVTRHAWTRRPVGGALAPDVVRLAVTYQDAGVEVFALPPGPPGRPHPPATASDR